MAAQAVTPPLIPRSVLFGNPEYANPQIAPDGGHLAYLAPHNGVMNLWVRSPGKGDDRPLTSETQRPIRQFAWQGDGASLLYLQDRGGDENYHLHQTDVVSGRTRDLTPFPTTRATLVKVDPAFPTQALVALNLRDPRLFDVHRIDLVSGEILLDTENPGDATSWAIDAQMQVRGALARLPDGGSAVRVRDRASDPWRELLRWGPEETHGEIVGFSPEGRSLILVSSIEANAARLLEVDLTNGALTPLSEDPQYDVETVMVHPTRRTVQAVCYVRARREWTALDPELRPDFDALSALGDGEIFLTSRSFDDKFWTIGLVKDDGPTFFFLYDRSSRRAELLFSSRPALENYLLAKMRPVSFPARDGLTLHGYLTLPADGATQDLPLVLLVHGGPWYRDYWGFTPQVQWLANRGYAVLQINFRGSTGYGKAFLSAGDREWAGKMHADLLDGKQWAIREGVSDPKRVAIMGTSYGGYSTLVGLAFTPEEFVCGVDVVGPSNLTTLLSTIPPYWAPLRAEFARRIGDPETEVEFLNSRSPLYWADRITAPLLIAQGANDPRVKQAESDQIVEAMRANGKEVEYLLFPDEGHGFARPENSMCFTASAEAFLSRHLGGRAEPPSPAEDASSFQR